MMGKRLRVEHACEEIGRGGGICNAQLPTMQPKFHGPAPCFLAQLRKEFALYIKILIFTNNHFWYSKYPPPFFGAEKTGNGWLLLHFSRSHGFPGSRLRPLTPTDFPSAVFFSMAKLIISLNSKESLDFELSAEVTRLGRRSNNEIVIDNTWISSLHAEFRRNAAGGWLVKDLNSSNGTTVNGIRIVEQMLRHGDRVAFGQLEAFFEHEPAPMAPPVRMVPASPAHGIAPAAPLQVVASQHLAEAEAALQRVQEATRVAQAECDALREEAAQLRKANSAQQEAARDELNKIQAACQQAQAKTVEEEQKLAACLKSMEQMQAQLQEFTAKMAHWEQPQAAAAALAMTLKTDQAMAASLKMEIQAATARLESDQSSINAATAQRGFLNQECASMEARLEGLRRETEGAGSLSAKVADLRQQQAESERRLEFLNDRLAGMSEAPDPNWGTVHSLARSFIKKLDLIDDLIAHLSSHGDSRDALAQLQVFRSGLLDILKEYSIESYSLEPGTVIDIAARKRIQIVETLSQGGHAGTLIVRTYRPGYVCQNGDLGIPTLLRKADVAVSMAVG